MYNAHDFYENYNHGYGGNDLKIGVSIIICLLAFGWGHTVSASQTAQITNHGVYIPSDTYEKVSGAALLAYAGKEGALYFEGEGSRAEWLFEIEEPAFYNIGFYYFAPDDTKKEINISISLHIKYVS